MQIIKSQNVIFNIKRFYNSIIFNLNHLLIVKIKNVIQILEISKTSFNNVLIEQNAHDDETKNFFIDEKNYTQNANKFKKIINFQIELKTQTSSNFQIDLKNFVFRNSIIIFEMISNKNLSRDDHAHNAEECENDLY